MAEIYDPPRSIGPAPNSMDFYSKNFGFDGETCRKAEKEWLKKLKIWCKERSKEKYAGCIIKDQVADGQAVYMIFRTKPKVLLIHIPLGDSYESRWAHRWIASDVKEMADWEKQINDYLKKPRKAS